MASEHPRRYDDVLSHSVEVIDDLPPITADDIAHAVERLEAGRESGDYTDMRTSDLYVLGHLSHRGQRQVEAVLRDPSMLPRLVAPGR